MSLVLPSRRRALTAVFFLIWCGVQILFFIPAGWPGHAFLTVLPFREARTVILSRGREALLLGAYSDRFQKWTRGTLVPYLKSRGIQSVRVILTTHHGEATRALPELQKNFVLHELIYPEDQATSMRETFGKISRKRTKLTRLASDLIDQNCFWSVRHAYNSKGESVLRLRVHELGVEWTFDGHVFNRVSPVKASADSQGLRDSDMSVFSDTALSCA